MVSRFPSLSETFVLSQMTGLIDRGCEVTVLVRGGGDGVAHADVGRYGLLERMHRYPDRRATADKGEANGKGAAYWRGVAASAPAFRSRARNPLLFGRRALSGRVLSEGLAWVEAARAHGPPDVVVAHHGGNGENAVRLRRARAFDAPVATFFHGSDANRAKPGKFGELFRRGDLLLPVIGFLEDKLLEIGAPRDRVRVHRMGIDPAVFAAPERGGPRETVELVSVGRLVEVKGFHHAIPAVAALGGGVRYRIVGAGPEEQRLRALIDEVGAGERIELVGGQPKERVVELLRESDAMVFPSCPVSTGEKEGLPMALCEGMAAGLAVVASRIGGVPGLIREGVDGLLVEPGSAGGLRQSLERVVGDAGLRRSLGGSALERVKQEHDVNVLNDRFVELLRGLVAEYQGGRRRG